MTEIALLKSGVALASVSGVASFVAVIDPSIQSIAVAGIGAVVTIVTVVFAFKTASLNKRMEANDVKIAEVIKTSDGMKDALMVATGKAERAEGMLQGSLDSENKANAVAAAKATGAAEATSKAIPNEKSPSP